MSDLTKDAIEVILKHLTDRVALAVLLLSLILLAAMLVPNPVGNWARSNPMYIAFGILGPLCYLPTRWLLEKFSESQEAGKRHKRLHNLTPREQQILGPYIRGDYRTRSLPHTDAVAKGLADDGVLYRPDVPRSPNGDEAYNIQDWARNHLKAHPDLLGKFSEKAVTTEGGHDKRVEEAFAQLDEFARRFAQFVNRGTSDTLHYIVESDIYYGQPAFRADCQLPNLEIWIGQHQYFSERLQRQPKTMEELRPALHEFQFIVASYNNFCVHPILNLLPENLRAQVTPQARGKLNLFQQKFRQYLEDYQLFVERLVKERPSLNGTPSNFNMPRPFV
jgi:Super-infection exclusion protein B